jgi:hypothetical protein
MSVPVNTVIEEAIRYEHNLAALYQEFSSLFTEDADLWWGLSVSEGEHAMLLETGRMLFKDEFSRDTVPADLQALRDSNESLQSVIDGLREKAPSRADAFRISLGLERDANELTLHRLLRIDKSQPASEIVTRIREEDSTHEEQVRHYADRNGISI